MVNYCLPHGNQTAALTIVLHASASYKYTIWSCDHLCLWTDCQVAQTAFGCIQHNLKKCMEITVQPTHTLICITAMLKLQLVYRVFMFSGAAMQPSLIIIIKDSYTTNLRRQICNPIHIMFIFFFTFFFFKFCLLLPMFSVPPFVWFPALFLCSPVSCLLSSVCVCVFPDVVVGLSCGIPLSLPVFPCGMFGFFLLLAFCSCLPMSLLICTLLFFYTYFLYILLAVQKSLLFSILLASWVFHFEVTTLMSLFNQSEGFRYMKL